MAKKKLIPLIVLIAALIAGFVGFCGMRENLPYGFEFVPANDGLRVINTTAWNKRDFVVSCRDANRVSRPDIVMKGALNHCEIPGLKAHERYMVRVRRADLLGRLRYKSFARECVMPVKPPLYVVLLGASVGKEWNLPALPDRLNADGYAFGYRGKYGYDKTDVLETLVNSQYKPDIVIIKECAEYFPKELNPILEKLPQWVDLLVSSDITPVLATCCPVTEGNDCGNPGRQAAINEFNQFVHAFAEEKDLALLDLEETLRSDGDAHYLRVEYSQPDGLHLLPAAYQALDAIVLPALGER